MTLDHLDRFQAYCSDPDTYYPPSVTELQSATAEIKETREFLQMLLLSIEGGGMTVTFDDSDLQTIRKILRKLK